MAEAKVLSGAGLRGQVAGQTALSTVGQAGAGLTYRGYDVRAWQQVPNSKKSLTCCCTANYPPRPSWMTTSASSRACVTCRKP